MDRNRHTLTAIRMAFVLVLVAASCTGCGQPMLYHFKHYHRPFASIARSNKTYFHSSQTGKIIEKDPCQQYCEPGCFGYEETCWTQWPSECAGNCPPPAGMLDQVMPYDGQVMMEGSVMSESSMMTTPTPSYSSAPDSMVPSPSGTGVQPVLPAVDETRLPAIRVPSIPADVESSIPSPSDSTRYNPTQPVRVPAVEASPAKQVLLSPKKVLPRAQKQEPVAPKVAKLVSPLGLADKIESSVSIPVDDEFKPIRVARSAQAKKPAAKLATKPTKVSKPSELAKPGASSRKPKTLADKLRVRVNPMTEEGYLSAIEATGNQKKSAPMAVASNQPKSKIRIVETEAKPIVTKPIVTKPIVAQPAAAKAPAEQSPATSTVKFGSLASKLKSVRPAKEVKLKKKSSEQPRQSFKAVDAKPTMPAKKAAMQVSDRGSSVIRFANETSSSKQRLTASPGSTVLKFSGSN